MGELCGFECDRHACPKLGGRNILHVDSDIVRTTTTRSTTSWSAGEVYQATGQSISGVDATRYGVEGAIYSPLTIHGL